MAEESDRQSGRLRDNEKPLTQRQRRGRQELGRRLRELREHSGLSLPGMAAEVGLSKSYLSEIETGRRAPTLDLLDALATRLGMLTVDVLSPIYPYGRREG